MDPYRDDRDAEIVALERSVIVDPVLDGRPLGRGFGSAPETVKVQVGDRDLVTRIAIRSDPERRAAARARSGDRSRDDLEIGDLLLGPAP